MKGVRHMIDCGFCTVYKQGTNKSWNSRVLRTVNDPDTYVVNVRQVRDVPGKSQTYFRRMMVRGGFNNSNSIFCIKEVVSPL